MWPLVGLGFIVYPKPGWPKILYFFCIFLPFTGHHPDFLFFPFLPFSSLAFPSLPFPFCSFLFFFCSQITRHGQTWIHTHHKCSHEQKGENPQFRSFINTVLMFFVKSLDLCIPHIFIDPPSFLSYEEHIFSMSVYLALTRNEVF